MQKARHHGTRPALTACRRTVSGTISLPCYGCFSPFPHGTGPLSVSGECLALADGPAGFTRGSTCPALLRIPVGFSRLRVPAFHRLRGDFPDASARLPLAISWSYNPAGTGIPAVWALPRSLATTLPLGTKMFQFPRFASSIREDGSPSDCRVAPFGNPRIKGRLRLPGTFRSLPRPSSPSRATGIRRAPFLAFACPATRMMRGAYLGIALVIE